MELRPPLHLGVVAVEKEAFGSSSTKVANFTYFFTVANFQNNGADKALLSDWKEYSSSKAMAWEVLLGLCSVWNNG